MRTAACRLASGICALTLGLFSCGQEAGPTPELIGRYLDSVMAYEKGDIDTAGRIAEDVLKLEPAFQPAALLNAKTLYLKGDMAAAASILERIVAMERGSRDAELWLARSYRSLGRSGDAVACLERILEKSPGDCAALRLRASLALDGNEPSLARAFLDRAIDEGLELALSYLDRARIAWISGDGKAALQDIEMSVRLLPSGTSMAKAAEALRLSILEARGAEGRNHD